MRSSRGQASIDYVALLALVALALSACAVAVGVPWLAPRLAGEIRHGICVVSGSLCSDAEARAAGLAPCPVHARSNAERASAQAFVVQLDRDDVLLVERRSNGTVEISFSDGWRAGAGVGIGLRFPAGATSVDAAVGVSFASGQSYALPDWPAAQRFLAAFAREETLTGEGRRLLRRACRHCPSWLADHGRELPAPSATFHEGGAWAEVTAIAELPVTVRGGRNVALGIEASAGGHVVLGRRIAGARTTTYLRLGESGVGEAGVLLGSLASRREGEAVLEYTTEAGRPVEARVRAAAAFGGEAELLGTSLDLDDVARWARAAPAAGVGVGVGAVGVRGSASVALDLRDPANLQAVRAVLSPGRSPLEWDDRVHAFGRRLDVAGAVDLELFRTTRSGFDTGAELGAVARIGGGYERYEETRDLLAAWSRPAGGGLRRREDCEALHGHLDG